MPSMIDEAFEALRELVLHEADRFEDRVLQLFRDPAALKLNGVPTETCKLALLSSPLWAETCDDHPSFIMEDFVELCSDVVEESLEREGHSDDELGIIARSLLEEDASYGALLGNLRKAERDFDRTPNLFTVRKLLNARMVLGRYDDCLPCLDFLKKQAGRSREILLQWCMDLSHVLCIRLPHRPELGAMYPELLERFAAAFEANRTLGRHESGEVALRWIRCYKYYLFHLENRWFSERENGADEAEAKGLDPDRSLDYVDEDFVKDQADVVWPLIRRHDELVLRHLSLLEDPSDADVEPIQRDVQKRFYETLETIGFEVIPAPDAIALN